MDPREIFDVFCGEKYKRTETAKSGVLTSDRRDTIVSFLENSAVEGESKLRFLIKKRKYLIVNKKLCQERIVHGVTTYLEVPTVDELYDLIKGVHEDCGHEGIIKTYKAIQLRYVYVPREVVGKFISLCLTCQQKIKTIKPIVSEKPLQRCQIDLICMDKADGEYKYIFTFIDHFSKFVVLRPLRTKEGKEVRGVLEEVFSVFGKPAILHSDNGGEFRNKLVEELLQTWPGGTCKFVHGRPRHPQSQGVVERANRTVKEKIKTRELQTRSSEPSPWSTWLPSIAYQINTSFHSTIRMTPYECMFSRTPVRDNTESHDDDFEVADLEPSPTCQGPPDNQPRMMTSANRPLPLPPVNRPRQLPPVNRPRQLPPANRPLPLPPVNRPRQLPPANRPRQLPPANRPRQLPPANRPRQLPPANRPRHLPQPNRPRQLPSANRPRQFPSAKRPRQLPQANRPRQLPSANRPNQLPSARRPRKATFQSNVIVASASTRPQSSYQADARQTTHKARQRMMKRNEVAPLYTEGEFVTVAIPKRDQVHPALKRLPAVVVKVMPNYSYKLRCKGGVIKTTLRADCLHRYQGSLSTNDWKEESQISLREAAKLESQPEEILEPTWPVLLTPILQRLKDSNCDEASCELALDTLEKIHWDAVREAAHLILGLLPALPTHPPTSIDGTQLGAFGDGYVSYLPDTLKKQSQVALKTLAEGNSCFYRSISLLRYGTEDRHMLLRLGATCLGIANLKETSKHIMSCYEDEDDLINFLSSATSDVTMEEIDAKDTLEQKVDEAVETEMRLSLNSQRDAGPIQCLVMSTYLNACVHVWTVRKGVEHLTVYEATKGPSSRTEHLVLVPCNPSESRLAHFVPMVEGELVGKGDEQKYTCGGSQFGLCQGKSKMVECTMCYQWYHVDCVGRQSKTKGFECGCHKKAPLKPKRLSFYHEVKPFAEVVQTINIKKLTTDILNGRYCSARPEAFKSKRSRNMQPWKARIAVHRMSENVVDFLDKSVTELKLNLSKRAILDVIYPEIAVHVAMKQEQLTRIEADLLLNICAW